MTDEKAPKVNRMDKVKEIIKAKPLSYQDIVTALGGDIALKPPVESGEIVRNKVGGHFLYGLPGAKFPDPPPAPAKAAPAKAAGATPAKAGPQAPTQTVKR